MYGIGTAPLLGKNVPSTHPLATEQTCKVVFGDIHMLSHLVGAANRADIRRLAQLEAENVALSDKIRRQESQLRSAILSRDAEIARDLVEEAIRLEKERRRLAVKDKAEDAAMKRLLDALVGKDSSQATRESFKQRFADGHLDQTEIEIELEQAPSMPFEVPGGAPQMINLTEMMKSFGGGQQLKRRKLTVRAAWDKLVEEEADKRLDQDEVSRTALADAEANGIVFLDEIDKIAVSDVRGGSVSREGVQRDLLPLIEGTTVATKYGPMKTDHILFIASGAFHVAKPSDLIPELQGRFPIRVELSPLSKEDFVRILTEPKGALVRQYQARERCTLVLFAGDLISPSVESSLYRGAQLIDGFNLLGVDAYKACIDEAVATARELGPVLGAATGVNVVAIQRVIAVQASRSLFGAIGREEAAIRRDPRAARDGLVEALLSGRL